MQQACVALHCLALHCATPCRRTTDVLGRSRATATDELWSSGRAEQRGLAIRYLYRYLVWNMEYI